MKDLRRSVFCCAAKPERASGSDPQDWFAGDGCRSHPFPQRIGDGCVAMIAAPPPCGVTGVAGILKSVDQALL
jgi:hypothetical protein